MLSLIAQQKQSLRQKFRRSRQQINATVWQQSSHQLCQILQMSDRFQTAQTVFAYVSFRQEPDLSFLYDADAGALSPLTLTPPSLSRSTAKSTAQSNSRRWGFPRCLTLPTPTLTWHLRPQGAAWTEGAYGLREPAPHWQTLEPEEVDLILVPAVACDRRGFRLGYGGGFYDRFLAAARSYAIPTIGICFELALVEELPIEPWDIPLNYICTEKKLYQI